MRTWVSSWVASSVRMRAGRQATTEYLLALAIRLGVVFHRFILILESVDIALHHLPVVVHDARHPVSLCHIGAKLLLVCRDQDLRVWVLLNEGIDILEVHRRWYNARERSRTKVTLVSATHVAANHIRRKMLRGKGIDLHKKAQWDHGAAC